MKCNLFTNFDACAGFTPVCISFLCLSSKVENVSCPCTEPIMATHLFQSVLSEISSPLLNFSFLIAAFVFFSSHMAFNASKLFKISVDNFNRNIISSLKTQSKDHRQLSKSYAWKRQVSIIYHQGYLKAMPLLCLTIAQGKQQSCADVGIMRSLVVDV